jgi:Xaa-Pro aminopeptidase
MDKEPLEGPKHVRHAVFPAFDQAERDRRLERLWAQMRWREVSALVLTSEPNFRYVANFRSPTWITTTRPRYVVLAVDALPIAIVPASNVPATRASGWIEDIRDWPAPRPQDEGISLVLEALREKSRGGSRIGFEMGAGSRLGFPVGDFLRLREAIGAERVVDATQLTDEVRSIKSAAEIARHRTAAEVTTEGLSRLDSLAVQCRTDRELHRSVQAALVKAGLDRVPYIVCVTGRNGYHATNLEPEDRALHPGDVAYVDVGGTVDGYFCDLTRHVAFGSIDEKTHAAYGAVSNALDAGIRAVRPGRMLSEVWRAMARVLDSHGLAATGIGRLGHGIGLSLTEWPSIAREADVPLVPGMALAIEPALAYEPAAEGESPRIIVQEENIVVTGDGVEVLGTRGPTEMTIAG